MKTAVIITVIFVAVGICETDANVDFVDYEEAGWELMARTCFEWLALGTGSGEIRENLGEPVVYDPVFQEATGELVQSWEYSEEGIYLSMLIDELTSDTIVSYMVITGSCSLITDRGVCIGSSAEEVIEAYAGFVNPEWTDEHSIVAGSVYGGVIFSISDGYVYSIFVGTAAE